ncbi:hypothetical protein ADL19_05560 [Streptomyces purpurogeneiscleroticus]|nr:hypothetical protein ADL19_05560 [Streptomyces purpurogeneiscleroticus]
MNGDYKSPDPCEYRYDLRQLSTASCYQDMEATIVDRSAIFSTILVRQALRREVHLPLLDIGREYYTAVNRALWRQHCEKHLDEVQTDILTRQRARHGADWPSSWGGRMGLAIMVERALKASFRREHPSAS